jgi:hypothetical protein
LWLFLVTFQVDRKFEVLELPGRIPEQAQAAFRHEHPVLDPEPAGAGLPPALEIDTVKELDGSACH